MPALLGNDVNKAARYKARHSKARDLGDKIKATQGQGCKAKAEA